MKIALKIKYDKWNKTKSSKMLNDESFIRNCI